jgi:hypothetical protein
MIVVVALPLIFLIGLLLCTVPLVGFFTPDNTEVGAPPSGTIQTVSNLSFATRQKLYLLFMLPAVVSVNAIAIYFVFYRHMRNVYYRIEVSQVSNVALSLTTKGMHDMGVPTFVLPGADDELHRGNQGFDCSDTFRQSNRSMVLVAPPTDDQKIRHHARRTNVAVAACPKPSLSDVAALLQAIDAVLDEGDALRELIQQSLERDVGRGKLREELHCNTAQEYASHARIVLTKQSSTGRLSAPSPQHLKRKTSGYFSA